MLALWLCGVFWAQSYLNLRSSGDSFVPLVILSSAALWPIIFIPGLKNKRGRARFNPWFHRLFITYLGVSLFSCAVSPIPYQSWGYWAATSIGTFIGYRIGVRVPFREILGLIKLYAIFMASTMLILMRWEYHPGFRLGDWSGIGNPNSLGMIGFSVGVCGLAWGNILTRLLCVGTSVLSIYLSGSRAAAVGLLLALSIYFFAYVSSLKLVRKLSVLWLVLCGGLILALFFSSPISKLADSFFLFTDSYRGVSTGGSGRLYLWGKGLHIFLEHPFLGVGFRAHQYFMEGASSAHNGYIATFADVGIFGGLAIVSAFFLLAVVLLKESFVRRRDPLSERVVWVLTGLVGGYLILIMFERYLVNVGNPVSFMILIAFGLGSNLAGTPQYQAEELRLKRRKYFV